MCYEGYRTKIKGSSSVAKKSWSSLTLWLAISTTSASQEARASSLADDPGGVWSHLPGDASFVSWSPDFGLGTTGSLRRRTRWFLCSGYRKSRSHLWYARQSLVPATQRVQPCDPPRHRSLAI